MYSHLLAVTVYVIVFECPSLQYPAPNRGKRKMKVGRALACYIPWKSLWLEGSGLQWGRGNIKGCLPVWTPVITRVAGAHVSTVGKTGCFGPTRTLQAVWRVRTAGCHRAEGGGRASAVLRPENDWSYPQLTVLDFAWMLKAFSRLWSPQIVTLDRFCQGNCWLGGKTDFGASYCAIFPESLL